ncbi:MAG TPA: adenylate kinase [Candidatus Nanopelagicaceae bacterium]|nr:adenylate kinase [Candidatus Nanopelagicaceae bacterium]
MGGVALRRNLVLFGPPGSGKGTQAELLRERYELDHIAPGDMLRQHLSQGTELGQMASSYMAAGKLVPDEVIVNMIRHRLEDQRAEAGFVLDGFPRTVAQAKALQELLAHLDRPLDMVLVLDVPVPDLRARLLLRAGQEQRQDDRPEVIEERLQVYRERTEPVLEYLAGDVPVLHVDGSGSIEGVSQELLTVLQ